MKSKLIKLLFVLTLSVGIATPFAKAESEAVPAAYVEEVLNYYFYNSSPLVGSYGHTYKLLTFLNTYERKGELEEKWSLNVVKRTQLYVTY